MAEFVGGVGTFFVLTLLQAVLGFDNLLYLSIESKRVREDRQQYVRRVGIGLAIVFRILLLFLILTIFQAFEDPFVTLGFEPVVKGAITVQALIVLIGGAFIIYTAFKEILYLLSIEEIEKSHGQPQRTVGGALFWIVAMNLVFSFDSILSAVALTKNVFVLTSAIVVSGILMIVLADRVAEFLKKNRMFEVLGLFILFLVGVLLLSEGGHLAHLEFFGHEIHPMNKVTFYFVLGVLVTIDVVQTRYRKKLLRQRERELAAAS